MAELRRSDDRFFVLSPLALFALLLQRAQLVDANFTAIFVETFHYEYWINCTIEFSPSARQKQVDEVSELADGEEPELLVDGGCGVLYLHGVDLVLRPRELADEVEHHGHPCLRSGLTIRDVERGERGLRLVVAVFLQDVYASR